jgi:hypothetical protein
MAKIQHSDFAPFPTGERERERSQTDHEELLDPGTALEIERQIASLK